MSNTAASVFAGATDEEAALLRAKTRGADTSFAGRLFLAKVVECYDGDTIRAIFSPKEIYPATIQYRLRMLGYDSSEMKPLMSAPDREVEKNMAIAARDALTAKLGSDLVVIECGDFDKNGRILTTVYLRDGENVNQWMVANGYGWPYDGKNKTTARMEAKEAPALQQRRKEAEDRLSSHNPIRPPDAPAKTGGKPVANVAGAPRQDF